jgi:hypothetical protein
VAERTPIEHVWASMEALDARHEQTRADLARSRRDVARARVLALASFALASLAVLGAVGLVLVTGGVVQ